MNNLSLKEMEIKMNELKPMVDEYYKIYDVYSKKKKKQEKQMKADNLNLLKDETGFVECEYPDMGSEGELGKVSFKDKEQAESLIKALRDNASYYYAYKLIWDDEGDYIVEPS